MSAAIAKAHALSAHVTTLVRYGAGIAQLPEPDRETARAIVQAYYLLLDENEQLRAEVGAERVTARLGDLVELCPALERWRALILEAPRRSPLEKAAAWELTALAEEMHGNPVEAEIARQYAAEVVAAANAPRSEVAA